jgi:pyruvate/2-oxoglutarate dehydrogenase complex dihydrolipoamide dehydrogenase (E3) component
VWELRERPARLVVLGGGPIGCELAQAFARFGTRVTVVEQAPRLLTAEDDDCAAMVEARFAAEGLDLRLGHRARRVEVVAGQKQLVVEYAGAEVSIPFDEILCAVGRVANTEGYGLEAFGIGATPERRLDVNGYLETRLPNIIACGDVAGPYQFTHMAAHGARYAALNALFGWIRRSKVDYSVVPWVTFTDPQVARVGLNQRQARAAGIAHTVTSYALGDLDRAIADGETAGSVNVLTAPGSDRILGVTIVGTHAGEMLPEWVTAMTHRLGVNQVLGTIHVYPTFAEANRFVAGAWRRGTVTRGQQVFLEAVQRWARGHAGLRTVVAALWPLWYDRTVAESRRSEPGSS